MIALLKLIALLVAFALPAAPAAAPQHARPAAPPAAHSTPTPHPTGGIGTAQTITPDAPVTPTDQPCWDPGLSRANECYPVCPESGCLPVDDGTGK